MLAQAPFDAGMTLIVPAALRLTQAARSRRESGCLVAPWSVEVAVAIVRDTAVRRIDSLAC